MTPGLMPGIILASQLPTMTLQSTRTTAGTVKASVKINTDGSYSVDTTGGSSVVNTNQPAAWSRLIFAGIGSAYFVRAVLLSGVGSAFSATDTWLALTSGREFGVNRSSLGTNSSSYQIQISPDGVQIMQAFNIDVSAVISAP